MTPAFLSWPVLYEAEETLAEVETIQTSKVSGWPENLIDFDDIGDSGDEDDVVRFPGIGGGKKKRIKSAPWVKKTVPIPFKMTIRFV